MSTEFVALISVGIASIGVGIPLVAGIWVIACRVTRLLDNVARNTEDISSIEEHLGEINGDVQRLKRNANLED